MIESTKDSFSCSVICLGSWKCAAIMSVSRTVSAANMASSCITYDERRANAAGLRAPPLHVREPVKEEFLMTVQRFAAEKKNV